MSDGETFQADRGAVLAKARTVVVKIGTGVLTDAGWRLWMPMAVFFVEKTLLTALSGASFGQRLMRLSVVRTSGERVGPARCAIRTALVCLVLPAVVIGADRRSLNDVLLDTVVVSTR